MSFERHVTFRTAPNIALIKYWGKRDKAENLPLNSSISLTLNNAINDIYTQTTVSICSSYTSDSILFNGEERPLNSDKKIEKVVATFRAWIMESSKQLIVECSNNQLAHFPIRIETYNSFPTAAGMASSASGIACLTKSLSELFQINHVPEQSVPLNTITRMASGSACRSLYGGLVKWDRGDTHTPSVAHPIFDETYWPDLRITICVVSNSMKSVSSSEGMIRCVETSPLMQLRTAEFVEQRIDQVVDRFTQRDFNGLAELIMMDSDALHAVCHSAEPAIHYLSEDSFVIIDLVKSINQFFKRNIIAYSFDAGSNAFLFYEKKDEAVLLAILSAVLQPESATSNIETITEPRADLFLEFYKGKHISIQKLYCTTVGGGPCQILCVCSNRFKSYENHLNRDGLKFFTKAAYSSSLQVIHTNHFYFIFNN